MRYFYTCWEYTSDNSSSAIRGDIFTRAAEITDEMVTAPHFVEVWDGLKNEHKTYLDSVDGRDEWIEVLMRQEAWLPKGVSVNTTNPPIDTVRAELHELEDSMAHPLPPLSSLIGVAKPDAINPPHYQGYLILENETLQWLEAQQYLSRYQDQNIFKGAIELQARKYLDRLGGKDEASQEIMKAVWYLKFLAAYTKNGGPIRVADIDTILART